MSEKLQSEKIAPNSFSSEGLVSSEFVPIEEEEPSLSDNNGNGSNGGDFGDFGDWDDGPNDNDGRQREYWFTPRSAYRTGVFWGIASIVSVFATISSVVETRWIHSKQWLPIPVPGVLYVNTMILLASSVTVGFAQSSSSKGKRKRSALLLSATLLLGCTFVVGQIIAWRELVSKGIYLASNAGSLFFYVITAMHALHLAGGVIALAYVILRANHLQGAGLEQAATESVALYWHFMDGLWVYLLILLLVSGRR
jgi:cytochrome c oxidase subunit III